MALLPKLREEWKWKFFKSRVNLLLFGQSCCLGPFCGVSHEAYMARWDGPGASFSLTSLPIERTRALKTLSWVPGANPSPEQNAQGRTDAHGACCADLLSAWRV